MAMEKRFAELLQSFSDEICAKLLSASFSTIVELVYMGAELVSRAACIEPETAEELVRKAQQFMTFEDSFVSAMDIRDQKRRMGRIDTGCSNLNSLLGGGIEPQTVTELYGEFGSGKTNICHQLAVMVRQMPGLMATSSSNNNEDPAKSGRGGAAIYLDTDNTFRPERIIQIAKYKRFNPDDVLSGIIAAKLFSSSHQQLAIEGLHQLIKENNARLVILDSAISHYRAEYPGRENLAERQHKINRMMHSLATTAALEKVAVVITNQVVGNPEDHYLSNVPAGGNVIAHGSTYRIALKKGGAPDLRIATLVASPWYHVSDAEFRLTEGGVEDVSDDEYGRSLFPTTTVR
jgi:DNA repair protein RadA